jgi:hypothetical protein
MNPNPITARDKLIVELQIRYRTFYVEFDIHEVSYNFVHIYSYGCSSKKNPTCYSHICFVLYS